MLMNNIRLGFGQVNICVCVEFDFIAVDVVTDVVIALAWESDLFADCGGHVARYIADGLPVGGHYANGVSIVGIVRFGQ